MTSLKQLDANRRNARKSTGPKTAEGKGASKMNALKHGLLAKDIVLEDEDPGAFEAIRGNLIAEWQPHGCLETMLVDRIAACVWRLHRAQRVERDTFAYEHAQVVVQAAREEVESTFERSSQTAPKWPENRERFKVAREKLIESELRLRTESATLGVAFIRDADSVDAIGKLTRYEREIQNSLLKALHELQRLQLARQSGGTPAPMALDVTLDTNPSSSENS